MEETLKLLMSEHPIMLANMVNELTKKLDSTDQKERQGAEALIMLIGIVKEYKGGRE